MHLRHRLLIVSAVAVVFTVSAASTTSAASAHFKKNDEPVCTISGTGTNSTSTTCTATLAGLGEGNLDINTTVSGFAVYQCQNNGGNTAPGQNRVLVGPVTAPTTIPSGAIKNGNVTFTTNPAVLTAPATVSRRRGRLPESELDRCQPDADGDQHCADDCSGRQHAVHLQRFEPTGTQRDRAVDLLAEHTVKFSRRVRLSCQPSRENSWPPSHPKGGVPHVRSLRGNGSRFHRS